MQVTSALKYDAAYSRALATITSERLQPQRPFLHHCCQSQQQRCGTICHRSERRKLELGKITKVYGDDYASTKPSVLEKIAERERLKAMLADPFEAEEAPPDLPPTPPGDDQA